MSNPEIIKRGFKFDMGEDFLFFNSGFPRKGRTVEIPLTEEDQAAHRRAKKALKEVRKNPWIRSVWGEEDLELRPLKPRTEFIPEETQEEWKGRWIAAGRPDCTAEMWTKFTQRITKVLP